MAVKEEKIKILVIKDKVMGLTVFRGYAALNVLAEISQADVFDQLKNPLGTQRDLNSKHAKEAYAYAKGKHIGFWPEVFLCARDNRVISFQPIEFELINADETTELGYLEINLSLINESEKILISRVDGNHRLHYADGKEEGYPPILKNVSFCITEAIDIKNEIELFRDINNNQRRMNTSHLDNIEIRLTEEELLKRDNPALYIANKLATDNQSPFFEKIRKGGKGSSSMIPLRSLQTGIKYMLSRPTRLTALRDPDAQFKLIRSYFCALYEWEPEPWEKNQQNLMLRGAGLWAVCFLGAEIIDRVLAKGKIDQESMVSLLRSGKKWDWSRYGDFQALGGRGGAVKIRDMIVSEIADENEISLKELHQKIMSD